MNTGIAEQNAVGIAAGLALSGFKPTIKPIDTAYLDALINTKKNVLIIEEHNYIGGLGESICAYMMKKGARNNVKHLAVPDQYSHYIGSQAYTLDKFGMWNTPNIKELFYE